ncbi:MAG: GreA/GreB family elongation factor [Ghiorsea sp.]|nr:GreA/GreB family elongation factor [Ghiorsea sp.]
MNKQTIFNRIMSQLEANIQVAQQAVKIAKDTATHKDCLGSSKYETMGTEASYLAKGQGERVLELQRAFAYFKPLAYVQSQAESTRIIQLTSLVVLEDEDGKQQHFLLAAYAGGLKINFDKQHVTVITPQAPLGRALMGKEVGDVVEIKATNKTTEYEVVNVL